MFPNNVFTANNDYFLGVHEITLKEVNKVCNVQEDDVIFEYYTNDATLDLNQRGLLYIRGLAKKDDKYKSYTNMSPAYSHGKKDKVNSTEEKNISMNEIDYNGKVYSKSNKVSGIRPVVV